MSARRPKIETAGMQPWLRGLTVKWNGVYCTPNEPLKGRAVFIIGGGPSVNPHMALRVQDCPVICVNNSYMLMRERTLVTALDRRWFGWHGKNVRSGGHLPVTHARAGAAPPYDGPCMVFRKESQAPWSPDRGTLTGSNSGHAAITLALLLGASHIYLIGFDMGFHRGRSHWHEGHVVPPSEANYVSRFRPQLEALCSEAAKRGHTIATVTPSFAAIPTLPFHEAWEHARWAEG